MSTSSAPDRPESIPESGAELRLALEYAVTRFAIARDDLANTRGQRAHEEAQAFLGALASGQSYSAAREYARHSVASLTDEVERHQASTDIWRAHIDALSVTITHLT